jgi:hypothetical protein
MYTSKMLLDEAKARRYEFEPDDLKNAVRRQLFPSPREMMGKQGLWASEDLHQFLDLCALRTQTVRSEPLRLGLWMLGHDVGDVRPLLVAQILGIQELLIGRTLSVDMDVEDDAPATLSLHLDEVLQASSVLEELAFRLPRPEMDDVDDALVHDNRYLVAREADREEQEAKRRQVRDDYASITEPANVQIPRWLLFMRSHGTPPPENASILGPLYGYKLAPGSKVPENGGAVEVLIRRLEEGVLDSTEVITADDGRQFSIVERNETVTVPEGGIVHYDIPATTGLYPRPALTGPDSNVGRRTLQIDRVRDRLAGFLGLLGPASWSLGGLAALAAAADLEALNHARFGALVSIVEHTLYDTNGLVPLGDKRPFDLRAMLEPFRGNIRHLIASPLLAPITSLLTAMRLYEADHKVAVEVSIDPIARSITRLLRDPDTRREKRDALLLLLIALRPTWDAQSLSGVR